MGRSDNPPEITIGSRIKEIRLARGLTQKRFAASLGIVQGFLSGLERGKKSPSGTLLIALRHLYGINPEWLTTGTGAMWREPVDAGVGGQEPPAFRTPLLRNIPQGFPEKVHEAEISDYVTLPELPGGCYAIINYGDFMAPTIRDGDLVIFQSDGEIRSRDIVLVTNRWGDTILRRYRQKGGEVHFSPDNPAYAPFKPDPDTRIIGRVIDVWRKVQL